MGGLDYIERQAVMRPEVAERYKRDVFFRVAVDIGHKHNLPPFAVKALQDVLPLVVLESKTPEKREQELRIEAEAMVQYHLGKVGTVYSLPSMN
jgi:hypothetical protein